MTTCEPDPQMDFIWPVQHRFVKLNSLLAFKIWGGFIFKIYIPASLKRLAELASLSHHQLQVAQEVVLFNRTSILQSPPLSIALHLATPRLGRE